MLLLGWLISSSGRKVLDESKSRDNDFPARLDGVLKNRSTLNLRVSIESTGCVLSGCNLKRPEFIVLLHQVILCHARNSVA